MIVYFRTEIFPLAASCLYMTALPDRDYAPSSCMWERSVARLLREGSGARPWVRLGHRSTYAFELFVLRGNRNLCNAIDG